MKQIRNLAQRLRLQWEEGLKRAAPSGWPPELELRSPKRTRTLLAIRKWLFGFALFFAALSVSFGELQESHFLFREYPLFSGGFLAASLLLWSLYFFVRRRIRTTAL